jgi:aspartate racemase
VKTLGLIGGMSWESTLPYYRLINEGVKQRLGGLAAAGVALQAAGAELLVLCTNTMHKVADAIEVAATIPLLHIADCTGAAIRAAGLRRVGLLGTRFTMEQDFYRGRLAARHGLEVIVPASDERDAVHRIIYDELCLGHVREDSRAVYRNVIAGLVAQGADAVILGCTEIGLLVGPDDARVPLFDTTALHAARAVEAMLDGR